jgi:hypothetical protein
MIQRICKRLENTFLDFLGLFWKPDTSPEAFLELYQELTPGQQEIIQRDLESTWSDHRWETAEKAWKQDHPNEKF